MTLFRQMPIFQHSMAANEPIEKDLRSLEQRVDDLIGACRRLKEENDNLRSSRDSLIEERSKLAEKNRMARTRLETIVNRLKGLEKHQQ